MLHCWFCSPPRILQNIFHFPFPCLPTVCLSPVSHHRWKTHPCRYTAGDLLQVEFLITATQMKGEKYSNSQHWIPSPPPLSKTRYNFMTHCTLDLWKQTSRRTHSQTGRGESYATQQSLYSGSVCSGEEHISDLFFVSVLLLYWSY